VLAGTFLVRRTTLKPFARPERNRSARPGCWVTLLAPLALLSCAVIPFEESQMTAAFGEGYSDYCRTVRRWI
jgi:protein-S-isoprenylcysteine O-methyltransferase Ste14